MTVVGARVKRRRVHGKVLRLPPFGCSSRGATVDEFQWRGLLVQERQLRDLAYRQRKPEILRDWWARVADILHEYVRSIAEGRPHPPPVEIIGTCANFSGYIAVGQLPDPIKDAVKTAGRRRPGPAESRDIGFAVAYCRAACGGIEHQGKMITIDDPKPVVTTANEFEVDRHCREVVEKSRTVVSWARQHQWKGTSRLNVQSWEKLPICGAFPCGF
jgi:hypothetical protein